MVSGQRLHLEPHLRPEERSWKIRIHSLDFRQRTRSTIFQLSKVNLSQYFTLIFEQQCCKSWHYKGCKSNYIIENKRVCWIRSLPDLDLVLLYCNLSSSLVGFCSKRQMFCSHRLSRILLSVRDNCKGQTQLVLGCYGDARKVLRMQFKLRTYYKIAVNRPAAATTMQAIKDRDIKSFIVISSIRMSSVASNKLWTNDFFVKIQVFIVSEDKRNC